MDVITTFFVHSCQRELQALDDGLVWVFDDVRKTGGTPDHMRREPRSLSFVDTKRLIRRVFSYDMRQHQLLHATVTDAVTALNEDLQRLGVLMHRGQVF